MRLPSLSAAMSTTETPLVTASLITYNHARYIEQAVESVLSQRTNFPFELVIGEDDSNDGTREIVQRLASAHPGRIRLNLHSRSSNISFGGRPTGRHNYVQNIRSARGKYIATLDGDDYWTDPNKLQRQVDLLERRSDCAICIHRTEVVDADGAPLDVPSTVPVSQATFSRADYLNLRFLPEACTVMFRRGLFRDFPEWYFRCPVGDFPMHVMNAQHGDFGFIDAVMGAYRIHPGGIWSMGLKHSEWREKSRAQQERQAARWKTLGVLYEFVDAYLGTVYRPIVRRKIAEFARSEAACHHWLGDHASMRRSLWKAVAAEAEVAPGRALHTLRLILRSINLRAVHSASRQ
jgi:glycosyltransferase involved in cell wall biosynthesis